MINCTGDDCNFDFATSKVNYNPSGNIASLFSLVIGNTILDTLLIASGDEETTVTVSVSTGSDTTGSADITITPLDLLLMPLEE